MAKRKQPIDEKFALIYAAIRRVPRGRVCSYGGVAQVAKLPRRARLVGTALRNSPRSLKLPWHRIITSSGRLAFPAGSEPYKTQRARLEREGVEFRNGKVDMRRFGWPSRDVELDEFLWSPR
jgi:methylated-DNA-protein-cysteine methyltransferase related protein